MPLGEHKATTGSCGLYVGQAHQSQGKVMAGSDERQVAIPRGCGGVPGGSAVKNLPANVGGAGDPGSIPGLGRALGGGNGNPLQYSCLGNLMDRGAWQAIVNRVAKSWTQLK